MILVVLGTHELPFTRLLNEVERLKKEGIIQEDVVVQHGHTNYESDNLTLKQFVSLKEMDLLYERARLIITHAGTGSIIMGLRKGKRVIACPRLAKYGEHNDDHQLQIVTALTGQGHILSWEEESLLESVIQEAETFEPQPFHSGREQIHQLIENFIKEV
ncbi:PssE/Cps14G family polysaccharide biosynthesis glycosyltransferase [Lentibacillus sp.]|uniref:PssE/Cps14G family polysaccharide biosynthesis glycosyltransferase n=1 Tax=Lentibacillus sp. TaxID=1925746 RepID=UPI002B4B8D3D|nr:PssE/Cps14G family polysaccharide biosynthesis glycosyltransferase [Lentibacillus sp.]HLS09865.1 PssE/Cps14G family polysaccharide biosynthesis glycosyltransferase [Lentibacillus sp.]